MKNSQKLIICYNDKNNKHKYVLYGNYKDEYYDCELFL